MTALGTALADYLDVRRALGYRLVRDEKLLAQFITYLEQRGARHLSIGAALAWATLPRRGSRSWWSARLTVVRGFATHLHALDPAHQVPPADLLPWRRCRATPYVYSEADVAALMTAATTLRTTHCVATYRTLIGLLVATGMRVGEALALDRSDFDVTAGLLTIRRGKFGKSRQLPLHPTTVQALREYLERPDRPQRAARTPALLVSMWGTRPNYRTVHTAFHRLVRRAGLQPRSSACRPRLHDLRHSFAVHTLMDAYRQERAVDSCVAVLSTYLGHVDPVHTYHYLSAAPALMLLAGARLERHLEAQP